ncbi:MAG: aminoglycoside phosphotransferase family protein [Anaerolineales bacterium]|nr:aminoglycoside phosphotransferase family protein [Anaerolineales bacterium]
MDVDELRNVVANRCPSLRITTVVPFNDTGQYNDLLLADGCLVLRFPRYRSSLEALGRTKRILARLQGALSLPTPRLRCSSPDGAPLGRAFLAYDYLKGVTLSLQSLEAIADPKVRRGLARQLGGFLAELHGHELRNASRDESSLDDVDAWRHLYVEIQARLFAEMRPAARKAVTTHFERFLMDPGFRAFTPSLRHGDFGPANVLYDPDRQTISGIIDFDGAGLGDPAVDLAAASCWGEGFFEDICSAYPDVEQHLGRAVFYRGTFALQEALYGLRVGDQEAYESGLEPYR